MAEGSSRVEDLRHLQQMFTELDPEVIADVYDAHEGDLQQTMSALFIIAKDAGRPEPFSQDRGTGSVGQSSSAYYEGGDQQAAGGVGLLTGNWDNLTWESTVTSVDRMLGTLSDTVTEGLSQLAVGLRSWVSDISMSLDASGGNDGLSGQQASTDGIPQPQGMDRGAAVVSHHGDPSDVLHHRSRVERPSSPVRSSSSSRLADPFGDAKKDD